MICIFSDCVRAINYICIINGLILARTCRRSVINHYTMEYGSPDLYFSVSIISRQQLNRLFEIPIKTLIQRDDDEQSPDWFASNFKGIHLRLRWRRFHLSDFSLMRIRFQALSHYVTTCSSWLRFNCSIKISAEHKSNSFYADFMWWRWTGERDGESKFSFSFKVSVEITSRHA